MTSSVSPRGSSGEMLDEVNRHLRATAVLLVRIFDAFARLPPESPPAEAPRFDPDFWAGLRDVADDLLRTSHEIQRLADAIARSNAGAASNGNGAGSSDDLALQLAEDALKVDLGAIIEDHREDWSALVDAIRAERRPGDQNGNGEVEPLELHSKVVATLPPDLRRDFRKLTEWRVAEEIAERQAAFQLGREIERQARALWKRSVAGSARGAAKDVRRDVRAGDDQRDRSA